MANSLFTGLFEHYGKYLPNQLPTSFNPSTMFLGQVLSVVTGEEVEEAIGNGDLDSISPSEAHKYIGLITFKMQGPDDSKYEDQSGRLAFPLDRSSHRLPLPGELVLVIAGFSGADVSQFKAFFYTKVITGAFPVRDAIQPYAITNSKKVTASTSGQTAATKELISSRFEKRFSHNSSTIKKEGKVIPTMREGDKLLEGRFGGSIRFTSTIEKKDVWPTSSDNDSINKGSNDGDPFLIIKATKETDDSNASSQDNVELGDDNINADMSSIYINTSQYIPLHINTSKTMYTWGYEIDRSGVPLTLDDPSQRLQAYFPDTYDPNFQITANADFPVTPGAFDDRGDGAKVGGAQAIPYDPAINSTVEKIMIDSLNLTFANGETEHYCARGTYNHAANFAALIKGLPGKPGQGQAAGGNANAVGYFNRLVALGYKRYDQGSSLTKTQVSNFLKNGPAGGAWQLGDVVTYWSNDGNANASNKLYGHTQMYTGTVTGKGNWTTDNKYNYGGSFFVYGNRNANNYNLIVFKPPQA